MSYEVLARKYRPSSFEEVVGQDHVIQALSNSILQDRIHQAFIFSGIGNFLDVFPLNFIDMTKPY